MHLALLICGLARMHTTDVYPSLRKHVSEQLAQEAAILKEKRKARESRAAIGKKPKDGKPGEHG